MNTRDKLAASRLLGDMEKRAERGRSHYWGATAGSTLADAFVPGLGTIPTTLGALGGVLSPPATDEDLESADARVGESFVPGVGGYRVGRRIRAGASRSRDWESTKKRLVSELIGPVTSTALLSGLGAGVGAYMNPEDRARGAGIGAASGLGVSAVANLLGEVVGASRQPRTRGEQEDYDQKDGENLRNYLLPGRGRHMFARRMVSDIRR